MGMRRTRLAHAYNTDTASDTGVPLSRYHGVCVCACARAPSLRLIDSALDRFCKELGVTDTKAYALTALPVRKLPWQRLIHSASGSGKAGHECGKMGSKAGVVTCVHTTHKQPPFFSEEKN